MCSSLEEKLFLFSVLRVVVSFITDFCVSSLLRGSNFRFLEMADWCDLEKDIASLYSAVLVAHRTDVLIWT